MSDPATGDGVQPASEESRGDGGGSNATNDGSAGTDGSTGVSEDVGDSRPTGSATGARTDAGRAGGVDRADVLLVEDNPGDVRLTREAMEDGAPPAELHVVTDGNEAMEFLHGRGEHADAPDPDLVLLDLNLPRRNGDEVLEELEDDPDLPLAPVVVLTSSNAREDVVRSYELGANAFLTKPVDPEAFIDAVQSLQQFWLSAARLPPSQTDE